VNFVKWLVYFIFIVIDQPDLAAKTVKRCHKVIWRVAGTLVQEKKKKVVDALQSGKSCEDKDLLALMRTFVSQRAKTQLTD
jgi:hypothetical protein